MDVTGDVAPVLASPSTISTPELNTQAEVGKTIIVETPLKTPTIGTLTDMFVMSTVGVDVNVTAMASISDAEFKPTSIGGNVTQTWITSPNDPWQAGVNFGGTSSKTAEVWYTDFENLQSNVEKGAVLRIGQPDVTTLSEVLQLENVYSDDSAKTLASIVGDQENATNQDSLLSLRPTPNEFAPKNITEIAQAMVINPDDTSFEDINVGTGDRSYRRIALIETEQTSETSLGLIDPEKFSFQDLNLSEPVDQNTVDRGDSDDKMPDKIAGTIDLEKASFEDIV